MKKYYRPIFAIIAVSAQPCFAEENTNITACILPNNIPMQPSQEVWHSIRNQLTPKMNSCLRSSDYFALFGASLLYTGDVSTAIEMLERALLINPENGAATVDYALALSHKGQFQSAIQVNEQLLSRKDVPAHIRLLLEQRNKHWEEKTRYWKNQVSYQYGHSSNLNNATYLNEIDRLRYYTKAESGSFHHARITSQHYQLKPQGASLMTFRAASRNSHLGSSDADEITLGYEEDFETLDMRTNWNTSIEHLIIGDENLYSSFQNTLSVYPRDSPSYLTIETRYLHFYDQDYLDELSLKFLPGIRYTYTTSRIGLELGIEINSALKERPGGDRVKSDISLYYDTIVGKGRLAAKLNYSITNDRERYYPKLGFYDKRFTTYWSGALQYIYPISNNIILQTSYYYRNQDSNIDLFKTKTENLSVGFTYQF